MRRTHRNNYIHQMPTGMVWLSESAKANAPYQSDPDLAGSSVPGTEVSWGNVDVLQGDQLLPTAICSTGMDQSCRYRATAATRVGFEQQSDKKLTQLRLHAVIVRS